jgi:uncharacterized membrane protein YqjE
MKITAALLAIAAIACVATIAQAIDQADRGEDARRMAKDRHLGMTQPIAR